MKFIATLLVFTFSLFSLFLPQKILAATSWSSYDSRCVQSVTVKPNGMGQVTYNDIATIQGLQCLFFFVLQAIVSLAGLAFFFVFISGGFQYLFSGGEQKSVAAASSTLTMAVVGLVGIIASWLIFSLIQKFTGINVTSFFIPS